MFMHELLVETGDYFPDPDPELAVLVHCCLWLSQPV